MASGKKVYLTMQQRLRVLKDLETSSISSIARKYNVHHTTIRRVKEKATIITQFTEKSKKEQHRKTIRKPVYKDLEQRLLTWFIERRTRGDIVSDLILLEKAAELKEEMPGCSKFKISRGWLAKFKRRNGIRLVFIHGKKASVSENVSVADIEQYVAECDSEEDRKRQSPELENMGNGRGEEQDDERDGERGEEMDEGSDEESAEGEGTRERGMKWNNEDREELKDIFKRLERFQKCVPRALQLQTEGLKLWYLGDDDQEK